MPVGSYVVGVTSMIAGVFFFLQPSPEAEPKWWESFSQWVLHSHPAPSYSKLPLFGVTPDIILRPSHGINGAGLHRRYHLDVKVQKENTEAQLEGCNVVAEWRMPRDVIVDQWLLHRISPAQWTFLAAEGSSATVGSLVDLEAPAYSVAAKPFNLKAVVPWKEMLEQSLRIEIPDLILRYQLASTCTSRRSSQVFLHPPRVSLQCGADREIVIKVEEIGDRFKTLEMTVPIATPLAWVNNTTYSVVLMSLFYLLFRLYKA